MDGPPHGSGVLEIGVSRLTGLGARTHGRLNFVTPKAVESEGICASARLRDSCQGNINAIEGESLYHEGNLNEETPETKMRVGYVT